MASISIHWQSHLGARRPKAEDARAQIVALVALAFGELPFALEFRGWLDRLHGSQGLLGFGRCHHAANECSDDVSHLDVIETLGSLTTGQHQDAQRPRVTAQRDDDDFSCI